MLLTLPATLALAVAPGRSSARCSRAANIASRTRAITGNILAILVTGLPAYVLVKVLTPAFYARKDVKTPVRIAMSVLGLGIVANFLLIPVIGIYSLATVTSACAWINFALLFVILYRRGHFRMPGWLVGRVAKQLIAARRHGRRAVRRSRIVAGDCSSAASIERVVGLGALVGIGGIVYFAVAWLIGGIDQEAIAHAPPRARKSVAE